MSLKTINAKLAPHGLELVRGRGYQYFVYTKYDDAGTLIDYDQHSEYVNTLNCYTDAEWVENGYGLAKGAQRMTPAQIFDLRTTFEIWIVGRPFFTKARMHIRTNSDGSYADYRVNDRWNAWYAATMAARQEIKAKLANVQRHVVSGYDPGCDCCGIETLSEPYPHGDWMRAVDIQHIQEEL